MSAVEESKKAAVLDSFFSRGGKKKAAAPVTSSVRVPAAASSAAAAPSLAANVSEDVSSADLPSATSASSSAWVEVSDDSGAAWAQKWGAENHGLTDITDSELDGLKASQRDVAAEEHRRRFHAQRVSSTIAAAHKPAVAAARPAASWKERLATGERATGASLKKTDINDAEAFPTLGSAARAAAPAATSRPAGSAWGKVNTNAWAALAVDEGMEEASAARSPAATGPASVTESSLVQGSGKVLASSEAVRKASESLIRELLVSGDMKETLLGFKEVLNTPDMSMRVSVVEAVMNQMLEAETASQRSSIVKLFHVMVLPERLVTPGMVTSAFSAMFEQLDDLRPDYPRVDAYLAELLKGQVPSVVPADVLPSSVAALLK